MSATTDIAIIGAAARFPDAADVAQFWSNLDSGRVSTRELPRERGLMGSMPEPGDADVVRVAAVVEGTEMFAASFFGYTPAQAELTDPAHRLLLEVCWQALESAAHVPAPAGPLIGVFVGGGMSPYSSLLQASMIYEGGRFAVEDMDFAVGSSTDFLASRVAYKLGLRGPSVAVSTACSSSLTAVHYAVLSLLSGECDIALAGGSASAEPLTGYRYVDGGIMSRDGMCRPFDARSTGTGAGAGTGVVVLRRLADAIADRDHVLAVIRSSAVGNDGAARAGFTAPSLTGVADVVSAALATAGVAAADLRYVEAHGSGTALGDRIELHGIMRGLRAVGDTVQTGYCALGSVKANIGHAGWAAGVAGLLKAVHIARTGRLSPHPTFDNPREPGVLAESPFFVPRQLVQLPADGGECHVLVNSMGLGGANAAVVVSPPPPAVAGAPAPEPDGPVRLILSAQSRSELDEMSRALAEVLDAGTLSINDVAHTLRVGRAAFAERRVVTAPAGKLAAVLRLPRPPFARTARPERAGVTLAGRAASAGLASLLERTCREAGGLVLELTGPGDPAPSDVDRAVLAVDEAGDATPEALEKALAAVWLGGAEVDFGALPPTGYRVPLPTYPFRRTRHWVLDRLSPPGAPQPSVAVSGVLTEGRIANTLKEIWSELFGVDDIAPDDEFGHLGGTSLLSVRMALEIQQRMGVLINLHRAGGSRTTIRRLAGILAAGTVEGEAADGESALIDQDIAVDLGEMSAVRPAGGEVLLTGATGFVGAFLLHHLQQATAARIHCVVRAADAEHARARLDDAAGRFALPRPDPRRVHVIVGDLRDIAAVLDAADLRARVGHVIHCAARVVFTEPYGVLRAENVVASVDLVRWMRRNGIADLSFVSSLAATGVAHSGVVTEDRAQPLDPEQGGYGVSKWVMERLLERAEIDGMRIRVFRPGLLLGSTGSGACNAKDMLWKLLSSGLAVGAHPLDGRRLQLAPVDVVARAIVELGMRPGSAGLAYNLVGSEPITVARLFELLGEAGLATEGIATAAWQELVLSRARAAGDDVLAGMALYEQSGHDFEGGRVRAEAWREWLETSGLDAAAKGVDIRRSLVHVAATDPAFARLLAPVLGADVGLTRR